MTSKIEVAPPTKEGTQNPDYEDVDVPTTPNS